MSQRDFPRVPRWFLTAYEKEPGERQVAQWELQDATEEQLRALLHLSPEDPLCDLISITTPQQAHLLADAFSIPWPDLGAWDYEVEGLMAIDPAWLARCEPHWIIFIYEKYPGAKVGELELPGATPEALRAIMGHPEDTNEYPAYAVTTEEQARKLSRLTESPLDLSTYHYVVHAVPVPRTGSA